MKRIILSVSELLEKLNEISKENLDYVLLSFIDCEVDQKKIFPSFLHFLGVSEDGFYKDFESIDSLIVEKMNSKAGLSA